MPTRLRDSEVLFLRSAGTIPAHLSVNRRCLSIVNYRTVYAALVCCANSEVVRYSGALNRIINVRLGTEMEQCVDYGVQSARFTLEIDFCNQ